MESYETEKPLMFELRFKSRNMAALNRFINHILFGKKEKDIEYVSLMLVF